MTLSQSLCQGKALAELLMLEELLRFVDHVGVWSRVLGRDFLLFMILRFHFAGVLVTIK